MPAMLVGLLFLAGLCGLTYWIVDCVQGQDVTTSGILIDKHHRPGWDEYHTVIVQDGPRSHQRIDVIHHPERFILSVHDGEGNRNIDVDQATYSYYRSGEWIKLRKRYGKRSKCKCSETVL